MCLVWRFGKAKTNYGNCGRGRLVWGMERAHSWNEIARERGTKEISVSFGRNFELSKNSLNSRFKSTDPETQLGGLFCRCHSWSAESSGQVSRCMFTDRTAEKVLHIRAHQRKECPAVKKARLMDNHRCETGKTKSTGSVRWQRFRLAEDRAQRLRHGRTKNILARVELAYPRTVFTAGVSKRYLHL